MKTINMTVGQALTAFLDNQYISFDGKESKFVEGVLPYSGTGMSWALERPWRIPTIA